MIVPHPPALFFPQNLPLKTLRAIGGIVRLIPSAGRPQGSDCREAEKGCSDYIACDVPLGGPPSWPAAAYAVPSSPSETRLGGEA